MLAALTGIPLILGGAAGLVVAALAIAAAARTPAVGRDTAVAVVVTGFLGLGALLALSPDTPAGLGELLFGDVLGVTDGDLALAAGLAVVVLAALTLLHGRLLLVGFDRLNAGALGARAATVDVALLLLVAGALLVAVQGLGNLLVVAVLVGPAACARALTTRMSTMMVLAAADRRRARARRDLPVLLRAAPPRARRSPRSWSAPTRWRSRPALRRGAVARTRRGAPRRAPRP